MDSILALLEPLEPEGKTLLLNLITSAGFFFIAAIAFYFSTSLNKWCNYGRETLGLISAFIAIVGIIRVVNLIGLMSVEDARLVNSSVSMGFTFSILMTVYTHRLVHKAREERGLPPNIASGQPPIPALQTTPHHHYVHD